MQLAVVIEAKSGNRQIEAPGQHGFHLPRSSSLRSRPLSQQGGEPPSPSHVQAVEAGVKENRRNKLTDSGLPKSVYRHIVLLWRRGYDFGKCTRREGNLRVVFKSLAEY